MRRVESHTQNTASLGNLKFSDFDIPTLAIFAMFTYWYLFPQHFLPFIFKLRIPVVCVILCILYSVIQFRFKNYINVKAEFISLMILGVMFFATRFFAFDVRSAKFYAQEHFHALFIGIVFYMNFQKLHKLHFFWIVMILYATFTAFIGFKEGGLIWSHNFLKDENQISAFMTMMIPMTIYYSFYTPKKNYKLLCYLCAAMQVMVVIRSFSRSGLLSLLAVCGLIFIKSKKKLFIFILFIIGMTLVMSYAPQRFFDEVKSLGKGTKEATAHARMRFWGRAWRMFIDKPIFGHGIGQFPAENVKYRLPSEYDKITDELVCHSNWFQILSELGLIGMICYIVIWLRFFKSWSMINRYQNDDHKQIMNADDVQFYRHLSTGAAIGMIGFIIAGTFINIMIFAYYYNFLFLMMTLKSSWIENSQIMKKT